MKPAELSEAAQKVLSACPDTPAQAMEVLGTVIVYLLTSYTRDGRIAAMHFGESIAKDVDRILSARLAAHIQKGLDDGK